MTTQRVSDSESAFHAMMRGAENNVYTMNKKAKKGGKEIDIEICMSNLEYNMIDTFFSSVSTEYLIGRSTVDMNGRCTLMDEVNRPIYKGDGVIPQIEQNATRYVYSDELDVNLFKKIITVLTGISNKYNAGEQFMLLCNDGFKIDFNQALLDLNLTVTTDSSVLWSTGAKGAVKFGAKFESYSFLGSEIILVCDSALTALKEKPYAIFLNTKGSNEYRSNVEAFTCEKQDMIYGIVEGIGRYDGQTSGFIANSVHGTEHHLIGTSGINVYNTYLTFIIEKV